MTFYKYGIKLMSIIINFSNSLFGLKISIDQQDKKFSD